VELPRLEPLFKKYSDKGFTVVAVERSRDTARAKKLIAEAKLTYHFLENGEGDQEVVRKIFKVTTFPSSFLIDRQGRVLFAHVGFAEGDEKELEERIVKLLAQ
jgi:peroxiredoxin